MKETTEEYLARGGTITKLKITDRSYHPKLSNNAYRHMMSIMYLHNYVPPQSGTQFHEQLPGLLS